MAMTPIERIALARAATATIDDALWPALARLQQVGQVGNGCGIYADVVAFKEALRIVAATIAGAQKMIEATEWPSDEDYDAS